MKNLIFSLVFISIVVLVITFLVSGNNMPTTIIEQPITIVEPKQINTEEPILDTPILIEETPKKLNVQTQVKINDDRGLFPGLDLSKFTNFRIIALLSDDLFIPSSIYPVFGPAHTTLSTIKIGTSDQGDVYFNGKKDTLSLVLNKQAPDLSHLIAYTLEDIEVSVDASNPYNSANFDLIATVNSIEVDKSVMNINQLPACVDEDTRDIKLDGILNTFTAKPCKNGYKPLDDSNLIKIKDPAFYNCIIYFNKIETNLGNQNIPHGFVNKNDIFSIECPSSTVENINEIVQFPNLQKLSIPSTFPDLHLINQIKSLKFLQIYVMDKEQRDFDIAHIKDLENIESILFKDVHITSPHFFNHKNSIKNLVMDQSEADNYQFLQFLSNIRYFDISKNSLKQIPELGFGDTIETIKADFNNIEHVYGFENYNNLKQLHLRSNNISNIDNLDLENSDLEFLELFGNKIDCDQSYMDQFKFIKIRCNK